MSILHDIFYTGKKGVYTGSSGLKVAYLSGLESSGEEGSGVYFSHDDVNSLQTTIDAIGADAPAKGVDIFLSSQWPKAVERYGSKLVSNI